MLGAHAAPQSEAKTECEAEIYARDPSRPHRTAARDFSTRLTEEDSYVLGGGLGSRPEDLMLNVLSKVIGKAIAEMRPERRSAWSVEKHA